MFRVVTHWLWPVIMAFFMEYLLELIWQNIFRQQCPISKCCGSVVCGIGRPWWSWSKVNLGTANIECGDFPFTLLLYGWNWLLKITKYFAEANWLTEIIGFCLRPVIGRFFAFTSTWTQAMASIESIGRINASGDFVMGSIEGIADEFQLGIDDGPCWPSKEKASYDIACYCRLNYIWIKILTTKNRIEKYFCSELIFVGIGGLRNSWRRIFFQKTTRNFYVIHVIFL